jgi:hypothetical protein
MFTRLLELLPLFRIVSPSQDAISLSGGSFCLFMTVVLLQNQINIAMKTIKNSTTLILLTIAGFHPLFSKAQSTPVKKPNEPAPVVDLFAPARVDFDAYEKLVREVKEHRESRLINFKTFQEMSKQQKVIILDARSAEMFARKHVKGAINLNFSDFTQSNLAKVIPSPDYKILIYCNNNFDNDEINFASKAYIPSVKTSMNKTPLTLALNIPTYINLYGYGYKNVYELNEMLSVYDYRVEFEGTDTKKKTGY